MLSWGKLCTTEGEEKKTSRRSDIHRLEVQIAEIEPKTPQQFAVEGLAFLSICCPENIRWVELSPEDLELRRTTLVVPWLVGLNCKDDVVEGSVELLLLKKKHFPHPGNFCSGIPENGTDTECSQADIAVTP